MPSTFTWSPDRAVYLDRNGKVVSRARILEALADATRGQTRRAIEAAREYARTGNTAAWQIAMRGEMRLAFVGNYALGRGGLDQMSQADYGRVGGYIVPHFRRLQRFARQNAEGLNPHGPIFDNRVGMYFKSARLAFFAGDLAAHKEAGFMVRNQHDPALDNCADCQAETSRGLVEPGRMSPPGSRRCMGNCACRLVYERPR